MTEKGDRRKHQTHRWKQTSEMNTEKLETMIVANYVFLLHAEHYLFIP